MLELCTYLPMWFIFPMLMKSMGTMVWYILTTKNQIIRSTYNDIRTQDFISQKFRAYKISFNTEKTEVRRLFSKFFTANSLFWEYLGVVCFRPKNQCFLQEKDPATLSYEQGTHSAKIVPIVWLEIAKMPPKISAQFVCPSPKVSNF